MINPEPLGYIVVISHDGREGWHDDWDGEVHTNREAGLVALGEARAAGYTAELAGLHPTEPDRTPPAVTDTVINLIKALDWIEREYRQCIVAARVTCDSDQYAKCNGRAEAYRQAADMVAAAAGLTAPDWDRIRREVPVDGIYRVAAKVEGTRQP